MTIGDEISGQLFLLRFDFIDLLDDYNDKSNSYIKLWTKQKQVNTNSANKASDASIFHSNKWFSTISVSIHKNANLYGFGMLHLLIFKILKTVCFR